MGNKRYKAEQIVTLHPQPSIGKLPGSSYPEVLQQPKAGFFAPVDYWLAHDLREMVDDLLSERQIGLRGFFEPDTVRQLIQEHRSGRQDWSMQIWQLLTLELWMQTFIDGDGRSIPDDSPSARRAVVKVQ